MDDDGIYENILITGIFSMMTVMTLSRVFRSMTGSRFEVSTLGYPPQAGYAGQVWLQMTPAGQPNRVLMVAENSTGAFEVVLLGLTT